MGTNTHYSISSTALIILNNLNFGKAGFPQLFNNFKPSVLASNFDKNARQKRPSMDAVLFKSGDF